MDSLAKKNMAFELKSALPDHLLQMLEQAADHCSQRGEFLYIAGGTVRDLLLGSPSKDIDLVVEGDSFSLAAEISRLFPGKTVLHEQFKTAKLEVNGFSVDIATARKETYDHPGALPRVEIGSLEDDLSRRDFSINSMAIIISGDEYGNLIDPLDGLADLLVQKIRVLHKLSFQDDPTRIFRAIRYEQRFDFKIEPVTLALLEEDKKFLAYLSPDRIRYEFECIFNEPKPEKALARASILSILTELFPGLVFDKQEAEWFKTVRKSYSASKVPIALYWTLLFSQLDPITVQDATKRLNLPAETVEIIIGTHNLAAQHINLNKKKLKPSEIYQLLNVFNPLSIKAAAISSDNPVIKEQLQLYLTKLRYIKPDLGGDDLIKLGYSQGIMLGHTLDKIRERRLNGAVHTREEEIEIAKKLLLEKHPE